MVRIDRIDIDGSKRSKMKKTKLIKNDNAVQVYCRNCDYHQLVPKDDRRCKECGRKLKEVV